MSDRFADSFARVTDRATMKRPTSRPVAKPARAAATPEVARRWPRERVLRTLLASTLLRVYRFLPTAPRLDGAEGWVGALLGSPALTSARDLSLVLLELLDCWRVPLALGTTPRLAELASELGIVRRATRET